MTVDWLRKVGNQSILLSSVVVVLLCSGCNTTDREGKTASNRECRSIENLGSRIQRPTCLTKEEWAVIDKKNQELLDENGRQTQDVLREALRKGSMSEGRSFDNPALGPY